MSDISLAPRRRPLWRLFIMPILLVVAALGWSAFWFYSASQVDSASDAWRAREAKSGRVYDCAKRSVAGFPFRLEVRCDGVSVSLSSQTAEQTATQAPVTAKLGEILVVAQVYDPKLLIAEFTAPATIYDRGRQPFAGNIAKVKTDRSVQQLEIVQKIAADRRNGLKFVRDHHRTGAQRFRGHHHALDCASLFEFLFPQFFDRLQFER